MTQTELVDLIDVSVKRALAAMVVAKEDNTKTVYKQTESRLYAYPRILEKLKQDQARLDNMIADGHAQERSKSLVKYTSRGMRIDPEEAFNALKTDLEARIACDRQEVEEVQAALHSIEGDAYFPTITARYFNDTEEWQVSENLNCDTSTVRRNRARLVQIIAVRLYGSLAINV